MRCENDGRSIAAPLHKMTLRCRSEFLRVRLIIGTAPTFSKKIFF
jgi:hypothetical protein